jgi:hypothetical protein
MASLLDAVLAAQQTMGGFDKIRGRKDEREQQEELRSQQIADMRRRAALSEQYPELDMGPVGKNVALMKMFGPQAGQQMATQAQPQPTQGSSIDQSIQAQVQQQAQQDHPQQAMPQQAQQPQQPQQQDQQLSPREYIRRALTSQTRAPYAPGIAGQFQAYQDLLNKYPVGSPQREQLQQAYDRAQEKIQSTTSRNVQLAATQNFRSMTAPEKAREVAIAAGMGYEPLEAMKKFNSGLTNKDLANQLGVDLNSVQPIYAPTSSETNKIISRGAFLKELKSLDDDVRNSIGPYGKTILGYSSKQIMDGLKGMNPEGQAKFLAARGLIPELNAIRLRVMGGQVGIGALDELKESSLGNIKAVESVVTPEVRSRATELMAQYIEKAVNEYNKSFQEKTALKSSFVKPKGAESTKKQQSKEKFITMEDLQ